jgi:hypothetical protein
MLDHRAKSVHLDFGRLADGTLRALERLLMAKEEAH